MKILYREFQQDIYRNLVEILKVLAKVHTDEATDAIVDLFEIATIVGVDKDLELEVGLPEIEDDYKGWTDRFCLKKVLEKRNENKRFTRDDT